MDFSDVPDEVIGWVGAGTSTEDPNKARMFFRRALDIYWKNTSERDTPTFFERKLRKSLASCCFCLRLYQEVLEHTARGLCRPIKDLLVHPEIYHELLDLEHHSFIAIEEFDRGLSRVDEMLSLTPMFPPLHKMRNQLVYIIEAKRQRRHLVKRSKQQEQSAKRETETSEEKDSETGRHRTLEPQESEELQMQGPPPFLPYPNNVPADAITCIESAHLLDARGALNCYCEALEIYTRAVGYQEVPSSFEQMTLVLMVQSCLELGLLDDVIRHTTRVIRPESETVNVIACLAYRCRAYELQGDIKKALADIEEYRAFDPLNKEYIEKHIELEECLKAEKKLDKKETVNGSLELKKLNESRNLSNHSLVSLGTKATRDLVGGEGFERGEFYQEKRNSLEKPESNEIDQAFLATSGQESTGVIKAMLSDDSRGGIATTVKKKSKKQEKLDAFRRQQEGEKIIKELQAKKAEQQKEGRKEKMEDINEDQADQPPLPHKQKKKKKKRKRPRRKTQTLRAAREQQTEDSASSESSDDSVQDSEECDEEKPGSTLSNSKYIGKFAVLQTDNFPTESLTTKVRELAQKPSPENEETPNDATNYELQISLNSLAEIVKRCDLPDIHGAKGTTQSAAQDAIMRPDLSSSKYVEFRDEVIKRGKLSCWICFVKEDGVVTEIDKQTGRCPKHPTNFWTPMLLWPRKHYGTTGHRQLNERWVEIRPRPHNRDGGLKLCDPRKFQCGGAQCGYPHSEEEREAWILDRNKWRFRRVPEGGRLELCRNYLANKSCPYGDRCLFAHGSEELMEWRVRPNTNHVINEPMPAISLMTQSSLTRLEDLRRDIMDAHNSKQTQLICDRAEDMEVVLRPQNVWLISSDQGPPYKTQFRIEILASNKERPLRRMGLIGSGLEFRLKTDCRSLRSSSKLVEAVDAQPPLHVEIQVEFNSKRPGCFVQDIILDSGSPPYVHQSVTVAVVPESQHGQLKKLYHSFRSLVTNAVRTVATVFSDSASLMSAACKTLLHPPSNLDEYKQHLHTVLYIEEIFSHNQFRLGTKTTQKIKTTSQTKKDENDHLATHSVIDKLSADTVQNQCLLYGDIPRLRTGPTISEPLASRLLLIDPNLTIEQKSAVSNILGPRSYCCLLIDGPPGAGKTRVLFEAARSLLQSEKAKILMCTKTTKSAEQFIRLLHQFQTPNLEKLVYMNNALPDKVVGDNIKRYQHSCESAAKITSGIVLEHDSVLVVATLSDCCRFLTPGLVHFTHVLIDEASRVMEVHTVMALTLATPEAVVVLAGDRNELQPFCHWQLSDGQSLFSRLSKSNVQCNKISLTSQFQRHPVLTQLVSCMLNSTSTKITSLNDHTDTAFHPFSVFACCGGKADQSEADGSFCNLMEAETVVTQVITLIQNWPEDLGNFDASQIFVVSCEQQQLKAIGALLRSQPASDGLACLSDVGIGTPWELQGLSPQVVIISTVMTEETDQDVYKRKRCFLSDAEMLYSAISEAKCMVEVVGDPFCLISRGAEAVQSMWRVYLQHCCDTGRSALRGDLHAKDLAVRIRLQSVKLSIGSPEFIPSF